MSLQGKTLSATFMLASSIAIATAGTAQAETLRWLTWKAKGAGDAMAENIQWFADQVEEKSDGDLDINVMWGGSAASQKEIPDAIAAGVGQIGDIVVPYYMDKFALNNIAGFFIPQPLSPKDLGESMASWHEEYPQFGEELARYNLKAVGFRPLESYGLLCTEPVRTLEDLKGKRIRSYGSAYPALFNAVGATPVSVSTTEAYQALERGILDCTPTGLMYTRSFKYEEVAKYYTEINLGSNYGQFIVMNLDAYNELSEENRAVIDAVGAENAQDFVGRIDPIVSEIKEDWKNSDDGVEIIPFDNSVLSEVIKDQGIQELRQSWIDLAKEAGLPADEMVKTMEY